MIILLEILLGVALALAISAAAKGKRTKADIDVIVAKSVEAIRELPGAKLTLRQIFYRLVTWQIINNTQNEFKGLSRILVKARLDGRVEYDDMEDRTRDANTIFQSFDEVAEKLDDVIDAIKRARPVIPRTLYQPVCHIIGLEKEALSAFFESAIPRGSNTILLCGKGFNSLTQIHAVAKNISELKGIQKIVLSYFGDFDPSGESIEASLLERLNQQLGLYGLQVDETERVCLTHEQVVAWALPGDHISNKKDSRNAGFEAKYGADVEAVEMNAIPPVDLSQMVSDQVAKYWDDAIYQEVVHLSNVLTHRFRKLLLKRLETEFAA